MKIIVDEIKKELRLVKKDGTIISDYSYKKALEGKDALTIEELKEDIAGFNETLEQQEEFDNIKDLLPILKIHNW